MILTQHLTQKIKIIYMLNNLFLLDVNETKNETEFSCYSYLNIQGISLYFNGNVSCLVNRNTQSNVKVLETITLVINVEGK